MSCILIVGATFIFSISTVAAESAAAESAKGSAKTGSDKQAIIVETQPVSKLVFFPEYRASANVKVLNESHISAQITAVVRKIPVRVGDVVKKGAELVQLDCSDFRFIVAREQAMASSIASRLALAGYQLQRAQTLKTQQAVAEELLKQRETEQAVLESEQANQQVAIKQAERNVSHCTLRSPFNAIVLERMGQVGELASPGSPLLRIMDAENREVVARLQHHQIDSVRKAKNISLEVRGKRYPLTLRSVTANIDTRERTREVRLLFSSEMALPGTAGELLWQTSQPHVPAEFILKRNGMLGVFVAEKNSASFHVIEQATEGRPVAIGLDGDALLITRGRYRLQPGDSVSLN